LSKVLEDIAIAARITGVLPMTMADLLAVSIEGADETPALLEHQSALKTLYDLYPAHDCKNNNSNFRETRVPSFPGQGILWRAPITIPLPKQ
jgi:hypothetical protein